MNGQSLSLANAAQAIFSTPLREFATPESGAPRPPLLMDENMTPQIIGWARRAGFDALTVFDAGLNGRCDREVLYRAAEWSRVLITRDKEVARHKYLRLPDSPGVVLLPIQPVEKVWFPLLLEKIFAHFAETLLRAVPSLRDTSVRYGISGRNAVSCLVYGRSPENPRASTRKGRFSFQLNRPDLS
jgi:predicted nuclease of predicted toxin-antitoxin system